MLNLILFAILNLVLVSAVQIGKNFIIIQINSEIIWYFTYIYIYRNIDVDLLDKQSFKIGVEVIQPLEKLQAVFRANLGRFQNLSSNTFQIIFRKSQIKKKLLLLRCNRWFPWYLQFANGIRNCF